MKFTRRDVILDYPEYLFEVDTYEHDGPPVLVGHIVIHKFSPTIFKRIKREWSAFRKIVRAPMFTWGAEDGDKFARFVTSLGYRHFDAVPYIVCNNGERRRLFIHTVG